ncbi:enoyl-CoA hydratase/isomerase family protein [Leeia sp. TBRC 13508]|uniref:Enoyl-CoA hydratase/isomerase family protein n=1 Tax=Leeia speluncae TaxID=2884804 RepID=A0ABS8D9G4_9NEIS|nr:enoyl-CoA hydratase/isomerase family protein [Leeia speluncae]MCB6184663.1 enoyl-CoA hydratase/isomerase family protein [Leeia speluncae]
MNTLFMLPNTEMLALQVENGVATITLQRPTVHNAFNAQLITELHLVCDAIRASSDIRVVILSGSGKNFSAGADLNWMQQQGEASEAENQADALKLANMLRALATLPQPTIARVQGAAIGGGLGLVSACDMAVAADNATFATSEVRLGLIPATIAPYVIRAIGERQAYRYFQTAERFDALTALRIGLLHEVTTPEALDTVVQQLVSSLLAGAPVAQTACKALIRDIGRTLLSDECLADTASRIAKHRSSAEGREGLAAFLEKRPAAWTLPPSKS